MDGKKPPHVPPGPPGPPPGPPGPQPGPPGGVVADSEITPNLFLSINLTVFNSLCSATELPDPRTAAGEVPAEQDARQLRLAELLDEAVELSDQLVQRSRAKYFSLVKQDAAKAEAQRKAAPLLVPSREIVGPDGKKVSN